jgi:hypothetical protein
LIRRCDGSACSWRSPPPSSPCPSLSPAAPILAASRVARAPKRKFLSLSTTGRKGPWERAKRAKVESNPPPADYYTVTPCRLLDSRVQAPGALQAGETRAITAVGSCEIPTDAVALALNIPVTQPTAQGNLRLYPSGQPRPLVSTINYSAAQTQANNAAAGLSASGSLSVYCSQSPGSVHLIVDVNGFFK